MQFVHQALTGAFLLALLPLLIHVINLTRQQRVQWAAMEFLLASYKKHRRWVWLKQFLLLLARIGVIVLLVMMCAQWVTQDQWLSIFAGKATHHYVLIDDSYSMSERVGGATAFDQARQVLASLATEAAQLDTQHRLTVLRYSQSSGAPATISEGVTSPYAQQTDFNAETINADLLRRVEEKRQKWEPTELAVDARGALHTLQQLIDPAANENRVVYLLTDVRKKDWDSPAEIRDALQELAKQKCDLQVIDCSRPEEPNLSVINVATETDTKAAGVPMFVAFQIRNFGKTPARRVQVKLRSLFYAPRSGNPIEPGEWKPTVEELPAVLIDEIGPGETVNRRAQVYFAQAGRHVVDVALPDDCVLADNIRRLVIDCSDGQKALVIDGSDEQQNAYYLTAAFHPLERSNTGIRAEIKPASFLREATLDTLAGYSSIFLLDVPRLDQRGVENLLHYAQQGGGIAIFAGDHCDIGFYNQQLYAKGEGLLPAPVSIATEMPPTSDDDMPDFTVDDHPIFSFFRDERNSFLAGVTVSKYLPVPSDWQRDAQSTVEVLATLRGGKPLFLEKQVGRGHVVACLSTLAPQWNDWGKNPSFVVMVLKLQSYLSATSQADDQRLVGAPIRVELEATRYLPEAIFVQPTPTPGESIRSSVSLEPNSAGSTTMQAVLGGEVADGKNGETLRAGIYELWTTTLPGERNVRRYALNVDPAEGNLATVDATELIGSLAPLKVNFQKAENVSYLAARQAGYNRSLFIMTMVLLLLLAEQFLAYSASYHVQRTTSIAGGA